MPEKVSNVGLM